MSECRRERLATRPELVHREAMGEPHVGERRYMSERHYREVVAGPRTKHEREVKRYWQDRSETMDGGASRAHREGVVSGGWSSQGVGEDARNGAREVAGISRSCVSLILSQLYRHRHRTSRAWRFRGQG